MSKTTDKIGTLFVSDNLKMITILQELLGNNKYAEGAEIVCSPKAPEPVLRLPGIRPMNLKDEAGLIIARYRQAVSVHCKQLFPKALYSAIPCVNIHPGFNPQTRGWFPQVWGIILGNQVGVTVHLIDGELDHGDIIDRVPVDAYLWDTSKTLYDRILDAEIQWLKANMTKLLNGHHKATKMESEGTLFLKKDFDKLCELNLSEQGSFLSFYNRLRALSFDGYKNAYFIDPATKIKVYLEIKVTPERRE